MKCEEFDRLLHLYFDGELEEGKSKELEEHLLTCQRCAEKLAELKTLEEKARRIKLPEPSGFYWKTFTEQVRNKIILRRRKSFLARFKSAWENFFYYSPAKLRIAAGIASVLLVFIIGKLYWNYHGKELERIKSERMEKVLTAPSQGKKEYQAPIIKESLQVAEPVKETTLVELKPSLAEEKVAKALAPPESLSSLPKEKKISGTGEGKIIVSKPPITVGAESAKIEEETTTNLRMATQAEKRLPPSTQETTVQMTAKPPSEPIMVEEYIPVVGFEFKPYYKVDETHIRFITEKDTSIEADTLKKVISSWKEYLEKKPASEWVPTGFSQIKNAYQLLFLKTKDQTLLQEGIELLNKYKGSITDQKIKDELSKKINALENLKKK